MHDSSQHTQHIKLAPVNSILRHFVLLSATSASGEVDSVAACNEHNTSASSSCAVQLKTSFCASNVCSSLRQNLMQRSLYLPHRSCHKTKAVLLWNVNCKRRCRHTQLAVATVAHQWAAAHGPLPALHERVAKLATCNNKRLLAKMQTLGKMLYGDDYLSGCRGVYMLS